MQQLPFSDFPLLAQMGLLILCTILCLSLLAVLVIMITMIIGIASPATATRFASWLVRILPSIFDRKLFRNLKASAIKKERSLAAS